MNRNLGELDVAEMPLQKDVASAAKASPTKAPAPGELGQHLDQTAILLDIDGTLLDLAPTPREVWVPPGLAKTLNRLLVRTSGALALVSGRSLNDIDLIFAPEQFPAVGGHGAEMRISQDSEAVAIHAPPMDRELKRRLAAIARLSPGILLEDKGYSLALHYRLAPHAEKRDLRGGVPDQGRSAQCADRSAAGEMRLRDQAFRLYQGDRRPRIDGPRTFQGPPSDFHRR